jgi:hypothetical protein
VQSYLDCDGYHEHHMTPASGRAQKIIFPCVACFVGGELGTVAEAVYHLQMLGYIMF